jgi:hypothetical protein
LKLQFFTKSAVVAAATSLLGAACILGPSKQTIVRMKWSPAGRSESYTGSLHFQKDEFDCSLRFYSSKDFQMYVESFGPATVPVVFDVRYSSSGKPLSATLVRVGGWDASKFQPNERLLGTSYTFKPTEPGQRQTIAVEGMSGCFDQLTSPSDRGQISSTTLEALLLSFLNLGLLGWAFAYRSSEPRTASPEPRKEPSPRGALALWLASASQVLYLVLVALWLSQWMRFYPGRPVVLYTVMTGLTLSGFAFMASRLGTGFKQGVAVFVSLTTALLWLLAGAVSVAV